MFNKVIALQNHTDSLLESDGLLVSFEGNICKLAAVYTLGLALKAPANPNLTEELSRLESAIKNLNDDQDYAMVLKTWALEVNDIQQKIAYADRQISAEMELEEIDVKHIIPSEDAIAMCIA